MALAALLLALSVPGLPQPVADDPAVVVQRFFEAYRSLDVDRFVGVMAPSIAFDDPTARLRANGQAEIRKLIESVRATYSDVTIDVHSILAQGERVAAEVTIGALVKRSDGSTRKIRVRGASFFVVRQGRIEKWTDYFDVRTFNEQLQSPQ